MIGVDTSGNLRSRGAAGQAIDWARAKDAGATFAIPRATYSVYADRLFERDFATIKKHGMVAGGYAFLAFPKKTRKVPNPDRQMAAFVHVANLKPGDIPPVLDVEFPEGTGYGMPAAERLGWVREAAGVLRRGYGCAPILYTSARVWRDDLKNLPAPELADCPLWLARYPYKAGPWRKPPKGSPPVPPPWAGCWWIWQYHGNATKFPGFSGLVDMNVFNAYEPCDRGTLTRTAWVTARTGGRTIQEYQRDSGLIADGVIGPRTFARLAWEKPV